MTVTSKREKEAIAEDQRRKVTALNTMVPLVLLVVALVCIMWSLAWELGKQIDRRVDRLGQALAQKPPMTQQTVRDYYYPDYFFVYYDANQDAIGDGYGLPLEGVHARLSDYRAQDVFEFDGQTFRAAVYEIAHDNTIGARYAALFYNVTQEKESFKWTIFDCGLIFIAFYAILIVFAAFSALYQIKPYASALRKNRQLVSDISHEFNTPLAVVSATLSNIMSKPEDTVEEVSDKLAVASEEVNRLKRMTKDMLLLSRSDNGKMILELKECDLSKVVGETLEPFVMMAALDGKDMEIVIEPSLHAIADADKVRQAAIILTDNALKYTKTGDKINVTLKRLKDRFVLSVADTGCGVKGDRDLGKIFERFYREDSARSKGGAGLGLAIVKAIAGNMGGKVYAEHNIPKGLIVKMEFRGGI